MNNCVPTFRTAIEADASGVAALHAASWRSAYRGILSDSYLDASVQSEREQLWQRRLAHSHRERQYVLLAEQKQTLVGFACVLLDEEPEWGACLDNLHVLPNYTGNGLGGQLLQRVAGWVATTVPNWPMHLWVFEANQRARRFYRRYGAEPVESRAIAMPGGGAPPILRYIWRDPSTILSYNEKE